MTSPTGRRPPRIGYSAAPAGVLAFFATASPAQIAAPSAPPPVASPVRGEASTTSEASAPDDESTVDEIVITSGRRQGGAVVGDMKPELQLGRTTVQSYGVGTVTELLNELAPQIRSGRGRVTADTIVLLNGRPVTGMNEVQDIPTEAIQRIDILPEDVALKYGYAPGQHVVNLVLRHRYRGTVRDLQGSQPTEGGRRSGQAEINYLRVHGQRRFNLDLKFQDAAALTEAQRGLTQFPETRPYDLIGNIVSPNSGAQIDPSLTALAGRPVTIAGVPPGSGGRALRLADFIPTAGVANSTDLRGFRTLLPATRQVSANSVLAGPLFGDVKATLAASLTAFRSESLDGLAGMRLIVPAGDPFSPFGSDVELDRYASNLGALRRVTDAWTGRFAGGLLRDVADWRFFLTVAYDHAYTRIHKDSGADTAAVQSLLNEKSGSFDPFGSLPNIAPGPADEAQSRSDAVNIQILASGPLLKAPAGLVYASFRLGDAQSWINSNSINRGVFQANNLGLNDLSARGSLDVPLARRASRDKAAIGELWLNANAAVEEVSLFGGLRTYGYGLNWTPLTGVNLIVSHIDSETAPTPQQLDDPLVTTTRTGVLDFPTGRTMNIHRIVGGNPALGPEDRGEFNVGLHLRPFSHREFTLDATYTDAHVTNPIQTFDSATTKLQAAFPDRFLRDAAGSLVQVDFRPVNFASERRRELRWGFNYIQPFGSTPTIPPRPPAPGRARSPFFEGGRLQFAVYHTVFFDDTLLVRSGGPLLDLLNADPVDMGGGQPRHEVEAVAGVARGGLGARINADWRSGTVVRDIGGLPTGNLNFSSAAKLDTRLFVNFDGLPGLVQREPWLRGSRLTISVTNLLDQRVQVKDANGVTPLSYQAAYLDPLGRTVRIAFRKAF